MRRPSRRRGQATTTEESCGRGQGRRQCKKERSKAARSRPSARPADFVPGEPGWSPTSMAWLSAKLHGVLSKYSIRLKEEPVAQVARDYSRAPFCCACRRYDGAMHLAFDPLRLVLISLAGLAEPTPAGCHRLSSGRESRTA